MAREARSAAGAAGDAAHAHAYGLTKAGAGKGARAIFFDRDGTLNRDTGYLYRPEDFVWIEGAEEAIRFANENGFLAIVVTNQSGIARGYYEEEDVCRLHDWMNAALKPRGAHLDALYYCPHLADAKRAAYRATCGCRKPAPGMVEAAIRDFSIDRKASLLIGDSARDIACAKAAGVKGIRFTGGSLMDCLQKAMTS